MGCILYWLDRLFGWKFYVSSFVPVTRRLPNFRKTFNLKFLALYGSICGSQPVCPSIHLSACIRPSGYLSFFLSLFHSFTYDCHWKCRKSVSSSNEPIIMILPQESSVIMYRKISNAFKPLFVGFWKVLKTVHTIERDFHNIPLSQPTLKITIAASGIP